MAESENHTAKLDSIKKAVDLLKEKAIRQAGIGKIKRSLAILLEEKLKTEQKLKLND